MTKLSEAQRRALEKLAGRTRPASGYGLYERLNVLDALERRGLAYAERGLGSVAFPNTSILWSITRAGRAALSSSDAKR